MKKMIFAATDKNKISSPLRGGDKGEGDYHLGNYFGCYKCNIIPLTLPSPTRGEEAELSNHAERTDPNPLPPNP